MHLHLAWLIDNSTCFGGRRYVIEIGIFQSPIKQYFLSSAYEHLKPVGGLYQH
jgi:hypothetical protein